MKRIHGAKWIVFVTVIWAANVAPGKALDMASSQESKPKLILTQKSYAIESDPEFSCSGTINGFLTLGSLQTGKRVMETRWIKPNGEVQENSFVTIDYTNRGGQTANIWLRFGSNTDGLLSAVGDTQGETRFNGEWRVHVQWDGKELIEKRFLVKC